MSGEELIPDGSTKVAPHPRSIKSKIITFGTGFALKEILNWPFDYALYPAVIFHYGAATGAMIMVPLSIIFDLLIIRGYDWSKTDWLLLEEIKDKRSAPASSLWGRWLQRLMRAGDIPAFFALSIKENPATVVLYFRRGAHLYNGMGWRDWGIFVCAVVVANLSWIMVLAGTFEALRSVMELI